MTTDQANTIYDLLTVSCGATEYWREQFVHAFVNEDCREYRCCEAFGTGGKFYREHDRWRVGLYREDETPERTVTIATVNRVLDKLRKAAQRDMRGEL